jgi:hypothetical protein
MRAKKVGGRGLIIVFHMLAGCCWQQAGWILLLSVWLVRTVRNNTLYSYRCSGGSCVIDTIHKALVYNMKYSRKLIGLVMIGRSINDPLAASTSPRGPRRAPGVRSHPHGLLQEQPVPTWMFDERAGDNAAPKLSRGLSLGPLSSRANHCLPLFSVWSRRKETFAVYL